MPRTREQNKEYMRTYRLNKQAQDDQHLHELQRRIQDLEAQNAHLHQQLHDKNNTIQLQDQRILQLTNGNTTLLLTHLQAQQLLTTASNNYINQ